MPSGRPPVPADQIAFIERWIDDGCPEDPVAPNGQLSWRPTNAPLADPDMGKRYDDVFFRNPDLGWGVNSDGKILRTRHGGTTWEQQYLDSDSEWGWKIQFLNDRIGFVSLENFDLGAILKTTDGGEKWERLEVNDAQRNANLEGIGFIDENRGWVGGWGTQVFEGGHSSQTDDGGRTWRNANDPDRAELPRVDRRNSQRDRQLHQPLPLLRRPRQPRVCGRRHRIQVLSRARARAQGQAGSGGAGPAADGR